MPHILFITSNRIGDAVLSTAALEEARARVPGAAVTIACGELPASLFRATPGLSRIVTFKKEHGRWGKLWGALKGQHYDLAVDLRGSLITFALPCRRRIIHRKVRTEMHKLEELARLMKAELREPVLYLDVEARAEAATLTPPGPFLALGAGAHFIGKRWPPERFAALARELTAEAPLQGAPIVLLGGPADAKTNAEVAAGLDGLPVIDATAKLDLLACAALLGQARLFLGNDSGLMHIAAASGAPTLGLFGPSNEALYGPWGPRTAAVRGPRSFKEVFATGYMPLIEHSLMEDLGVEAVHAAAHALLAK